MKLKKSLVTVGTAAVLLLTSTVLTEPAFAERSLQDVKNERKEIKVELNKAEKKVAEVLKEIKQLENAIKENEKQLKKTEKTIQKLEKEIAELQEEIDVIQEEIEIRDEIIKERISAYQANGGNVHILEIITGAKDFVDLISRVEAAVTITKADQDIITKHQQQQKELEEKQALQEKKLDNQEEKKAELVEIEKTQKAQKKQLKEKEKNLKKEVEKLKLKDQDLARIEASLIEPTYSATTATNADNGGSGGSSGNSGNSGNSGAIKTVAYTGTGGSAIQAGYKVLGTPYVWAGKEPGGFDCSGFVSWAYRQEGISLPSSTSALASVGTKIPYSQAKPGDLVFFNTYKTNGHVGIYLGNGKFIGAQNSTGVAVADMNSGYWKKHFSGHVRRVK